MLMPVAWIFEQGHTNSFEDMGLSCFTEGGGSVCMDMFPARTDVCQEFRPKRLFWEGKEWGLLVIWPGESAVFSFGEDRL